MSKDRRVLGSNPDWTIYYTGQLFKACGNNYFAQIAHIFRQFCKGVKLFHFSSKISFGQLLKTFGNFFLVTMESSYHWEMREPNKEARKGLKETGASQVTGDHDSYLLSCQTILSIVLVHFLYCFGIS